MDKAEKRELVSSLQDAFNASGSVVVAHYSGLTVADMENLRVQMKQAGGQVKVAKNRLAKLALENADIADFGEFLTGPTVLTYAEDPITAAKISAKFAKTNDKYVVLGGAMGETKLDAANVAALAELPSLDELRAKLAGLVKQPATKVAAVLNAPGGQIARVISAYSTKGEEAA
ncbi:50S ribosomal protein L10 [Maritalea porphyrae]|uniref:Large ribosomal subunit protein uL10 n=1 Tax=Maritalea porphyrae TaxID=880732 RepID=A0ABQ5UVW1_9HYPH|nr:50S ribosomal protein L10 [Maritalea porphyrae]GLQ19029.1 50S ribosomal protein L10 [Maritalea porphyrae]